MKLSLGEIIKASGAELLKGDEALALFAFSTDTEQ